MSRIDPLLGGAPVARIAGPHQNTVATILRAVELGLFTTADADMMIDRVRAHLTALPTTAPVASLSSAADGSPGPMSGPAPDVLPHSPDRTF